MFLRRETKRVGNKTYEYYAVVENRREGGRVRQHIVAYLGRLDLQDAQRVMVWLRGLALLAPRAVAGDADEVVVEGSGGEAVLRAVLRAWSFWGLDAVLQEAGLTAEEIRLVAAMVANRCVDPGSKLYVSQWYPRTALPRLLGLPPEAVYDESLYRAMDRFLPAKAKVERAIFDRLGSVGESAHVVLYDVTSTYFHARTTSLIRPGYSRDKRRDRPQITLGLVTTSGGFPITHRVFPGNRVDVTTLTEVHQDLRVRFGIDRAVFVGDRGMMSEANVKALLRGRYRYILALRQPVIPRTPEGFWTALAEQGQREGRRVLTDLRRGRVRYVVGYNPEVAETERDHREARLQRAEQDLARLAASARKGRYRQRDRLLQRAMRLVTLLRVDRFFEIQASRRGRPRLQFRRNTAALAREARKDGVFVLRTNVLDLPATEVVAAYQSLQQVERAFLGAHEVNDRDALTVDDHLAV